MIKDQPNGLLTTARFLVPLLTLLKAWCHQVAALRLQYQFPNPRNLRSRSILCC